MARPIPDLEPMQASEAAVDDVVIIDDTSDSETKKMAVDQLLKLIIPTGLITPFGGPSAPDGFLLCDGAAVSRTTYADLFAVIGESYGAGDGSNTFNLPDLQGRVPVGLDTGQTEFNTLGKTGGHKLMQSHAHDLVNNTEGWVSANSGTSMSGYVLQTTNSGNFRRRISTVSVGGGDSQNLQPYAVTNYLIKT